MKMQILSYKHIHSSQYIGKSAFIVNQCKNFSKIFIVNYRLTAANSETVSVKPSHLLMSATPLSVVSEDFTIVEYLLQLQLKAPQFRLKECLDISNQTSNEKFLTYVSNMPNANIVDVLISLDKLQQPLSDIINRGVRVNPQVGLRFKTNGFDINRDEQTFEVLHLAIALGTIQNFEIQGGEIKEVSYNRNEPTPSDLLPQYDTLRLNEDNEFIIYNQNQVKATHLVRFDGGDNLSPDPPVFTRCAVCGKDNATLWCENDCIKLCSECDEKTHKSNPVFEKHTRVALTESQADFQTCPLHPKNRVQYYCPKCHCPVCLECKIHGSHSKGEAARHHLVSVAEAFNNTRQELSAPNKSFENRQRMIKERLLKVDRRLDELVSGETDIINQIKLAAQKAIEEAHHLYLQKSQSLKSARTELERKMNEVEYLETMISTHRDTSEPLDLLQANFANNTLLSEIKKDSDLPLPPEDDGEIVIKTFMSIGIDKKQKSEILNRDVHLNELGTDFTESTVGTQESQRSKRSKDPTLGTVMNTNYQNSKDVKISSLARMALRKKEKYSRQGIDLDFVPFNHSKILSDEVSRTEIYLTLPFKSTPQTKLLYSSERDGRSIERMHSCIDGTGITAVLVKVGDHVFGGFAASKWNSDGKSFGQNSSSFLFSVDRDAFIPHKPLSDEPVCLWADSNSITFGKYDLRLEGNLDKCSSTIENNFGVGFEYGSNVCKTFLAGSPVFKPDIVEVWGFFSDSK